MNQRPCRPRLLTSRIVTITVSFALTFAGLVATSTPASAAEKWKLPWAKGQSWNLTQGLHSNAYDLQPIPVSSAEVLAIASGTAKLTCQDSWGQATVALTIGGKTFKYAHLNTASVKKAKITSSGVKVPQGYVLGKLNHKNPPYTAANWNLVTQGKLCGVGANNHLHLIVPSATVTLDGYTPPRSISGPTKVSKASTNVRRTTLSTSPRSLTATPTPTISGSTVVESTLTANAGSWKPAPVTVKYQWKRAGSAISGATKSSYKLVTADLGKTISVTVTGSKSGYTSVAKTSKSTATVTRRTLSASPTPTITGDAVVDGSLTVSPGDWAPAPVAFTYQWQRDGVAIGGATAASYTPAQSDLGRTLSVAVTGTKTNYSPVTRVSAPTASITALTLSHTPAPTIVGTPRLGATLTAEPGTWLPGPVTLRYQWLRDGTAISGATAPTYQSGEGDIGKVISVQVSGSKPGYADVTTTSAPTDVITADMFTTAPVPTIGGKAEFDSTLSVDMGVWTPAPAALTYVWARNGAAISGATGTTYQLQALDVGKAITVTVAATSPGYQSAARTSAPTATVSAKALTAATPTLSGTKKQTYQLTAAPGTWTAGTALKYQWKRNDRNIGGATGSKYTLGSSDVGTRISVTVTGTKAGHVTTSRTSAKTGAIAKAVFGKAMVKTQRQAGPSLTSRQHGWYDKGASLVLTCYSVGQAVSGYYSAYVPGGKSKIWYKVKDGYFVADIDINTGTNAVVTGKC